MKSRRLFFGFKLNKILTVEIRKFQNEYMTKNPQSADIKWVIDKNLHVTLLFLGETPENKIEEICRNTKKILFNANSFFLKPDLYCTFPHRKRRMIWLRFCPSEKFEKLFLKMCKLHLRPSENRKIIPHITLSRFKPNRIDSFEIAIENYDSFSFDKLNLYQSELKSDGAIYTVLQTFEFGNRI